ncbi:hypothetical protein KQI84_07880 [bacterium]|nr:hypothetical protein [bacterium]
MAEILVVLVILALGSTIALYSYSNYRKSLSVQSSARKLQAALSTARGFSINTNRRHSVVIDLDRQLFWIDALNAAGTDTIPKVVPEEAFAEFVVVDQLRIDSNVYTDGRRTIPFTPDGGNPYVVILLRREFDDPSADESFFSIRMESNSGEPQILPKRKL